MGTPGKDTAPFLQNNPATTSSGPGAHPPYESRPQKMGTTNQPDGDSKQRGPDRPQKESSAPTGNPESVPSGGTDGGRHPYPGPSTPTQTPFKLGK